MKACGVGVQTPQPAAPRPHLGRPLRGPRAPAPSAGLPSRWEAEALAEGWTRMSGCLGGPQGVPSSQSPQLGCTVSGGGVGFTSEASQRHN